MATSISAIWLDIGSGTNYGLIEAYGSSVFRIDWGDGTVEQSPADFDLDGDGEPDQLQTSHSYNEDGPYLISVRSALDTSQPAYLRAYCFANDIVGGSIRGSALDDLMIAGFGNDTVVGYGGRDWLNGGFGDDRLYGYEGSDVLRGEDGNDALIAGAGADRLEGGTGRDQLQGGDDRDIVFGGDDDDRLYGDADLDYLDGGNGNDILQGGSDSDYLDGGESGADRLYGGTGDDIYRIGRSGIGVYENQGEGIDTVRSSISTTLAANVENLELAGAINGTGNALDNILTGSFRTNTLQGGAGNDTLIGSGAADRLYGNAGSDVFVFMDITDSALTARDGIYDFVEGGADRIDLSAIDANADPADGNQAFTLITGAYTGIAGQLRTFSNGTNSYVEGDTNGDRKADFQIVLSGVHSLHEADFVL